MSPVFDIKCNDCGWYGEALGEHNNLVCPACNSVGVFRKWTGAPVIVMAGEPGGSTRGVKLKADEIMKKEKANMEKRREG